MTRRIRIRPQADEDISAAADYYATSGSEEVAAAFLGADERTFQFLCDRPHAGASQEWLASNLRGCRRWAVSKPFDSYQVFYCPTDAAIDVIRVLHGARDVDAAFGAPF